MRTQDNKRPVLVTGAGGFVGRALVSALHSSAGYRPLPAYHRLPSRQESPFVFDLTDAASCRELFRGTGIDAVIHLAAHVHQFGKGSRCLEGVRAVNLEGTLHLARAAAAGGVRRFIYLSSVKVNGERTLAGQRFSPASEPRPQDPYGISKLEAETALFDLGEQAEMEIVVVRPPLVYGPGVKANFRDLMALVAKSIPLPLGLVRNRRSLLYLSNLVDLLLLCLEHPAAQGQVFFAADREEASTPELLRLIGQVMGVPVRLFPVPESLLRLTATLLGQESRASKLCDSLLVDWSRTRELLGWEPRYSLREGLERTVSHFLGEDFETP